ncbi:MFS transporter [Streptacidiphilus sp. N1-3]|uniref:MFS transporter n=1 Tax=Streptacidiphilus alkalitolerans TaxID=3342712 RepID=A0ABV6WV74_9ACTN
MAAALTNYRLLYLSNAVSRVGGGFFPVGLAFAVLDLTGSAADLGYTLGAAAVVELGFLLLGGTAADRWPRVRVLLLTSLTSAVLEIFTAISILTNCVRVWELVALSAASGLTGAFSRPAAQGLIPMVAPADGLQRANAQIRLANSVCVTLGPSLAGLLVAATSPAWAILIDAASFVASIPILLKLSRGIAASASEAPVNAPDVPGFIDQIREGWTEFRSRSWLWMVVLQSTFANVGSYAGRLLLMPVAMEQHYGGASTWGFLLSARCLGYVLGGLTGIAWKPRHSVPVCVAYLLGGVLPLVALATRQQLWIVLLAALAAGFCVEQHNLLWDTALQQRLPLRILSRAYAYDQLGSELFTPVGLFFGGAIVGSIGISSALWGCAALIGVPTVVVFSAVMLREVSGLDPEIAAVLPDQ